MSAAKFFLLPLSSDGKGPGEGVPFFVQKTKIPPAHAGGLVPRSLQTSPTTAVIMRVTKSKTESHHWRRIICPRRVIHRCRRHIHGCRLHIYRRRCYRDRRGRHVNRSGGHIHRRRSHYHGSRNAYGEGHPRLRRGSADSRHRHYCQSQNHFFHIHLSFQRSFALYRFDAPIYFLFNKRYQ